MADAIIAFQLVYRVRSTNGAGRASRAARSFARARSSAARTSVSARPSRTASEATVAATNSTFLAGLWCISPAVPMS